MYGTVLAVCMAIRYRQVQLRRDEWLTIEWGYLPTPPARMPKYF